MINVNLTNFKFIINFEYVSILIFSVMLVYMLVQKKFSLKRSRIFMSIIVLNIIATVLDIVASNLLNRIIDDPTLKGDYLYLANALSTGYFFFLFVSIFAFSHYAVSITCGIKYIHKSKARISYTYFPAITVVIAIIINFFVCSLIQYDFDKNFIMKINIVPFIIYLGLCSIYLIQPILLLIRYKAIFVKKQIYAMSMVLPMMLVGMIIEVIYPELLVLSFMISISIILIQTVLESSEDLVDSKTNLPNIDEFMKAVKKIFLTKDDDMTIVLIRMVNYKNFISSYSNRIISDFYDSVGQYFLKFKRKKRIKDELYALNNGYYASICPRNVYVDIAPDDFYADKLTREFFPEFLPEFEMCYLEPFVDFSDSDEVITFVNSYRETIKFDKNFVKYSDVKYDKDLIISNHLEQIIDTGLRESEFRVYYQPIYSIKDRKFKTAEALVRLISKKYGFISPVEFIPYAENNGRVADIDAFVMEEVFKFTSSETFEKLGLDYIEINLSMAECVNSSLVERVTRLMEKYNVDPKRINLEITESFDSSDQEEINNNLNKLINLGFRFSLDDYGTGYSNIKRFSSLPISIIKIDKTLVDDSDNAEVVKILEYSFDLVKELDKESVVEGVETKEQFEKFKQYGANYIQGFYFSKPLNYASYIQFLEENN